VGIDIRIACKTAAEVIPPSPNYAVKGEMTEGSDCDGATYSLNSMTRYYGQSYERGPWPHIAAYLMELMATPGIEAVWYGGDCDDHMDRVTIEWLTQMNQHFIDNGNRPYQGRAPRIERSVTVVVSEKPV